MVRDGEMGCVERTGRGGGCARDEVRREERQVGEEGAQAERVRVASILLQLLQQLERRKMVPLLQQEVHHAVAQRRPPLVRRAAARRLHPSQYPAGPTSIAGELAGRRGVACGRGGRQISRGRLEAGGKEWGGKETVIWGEAS